MTNYQTLPCPKCNGAGCSTCQNTGKIRIAADQLQKIKQMVNQTSTSPTNTSQTAPAIPQTSPVSQSNTYKPLEKIRQNANLAGIATFSILSILTGGAAASWYFLKSLKPFFASLITLFVSLGTYIAWHNSFFQPHQPNDFLSAIKKI